MLPFSDTHKLNLSILKLNFQCVGVAKEGNIKMPRALKSLLVFDPVSGGSVSWRLFFKKFDFIIWFRIASTSFLKISIPLK